MTTRTTVAIQVVVNVSRTIYGTTFSSSRSIISISNLYVILKSRTFNLHFYIHKIYSHVFRPSPMSLFHLFKLFWLFSVFSVVIILLISFLFSMVVPRVFLFLFSMYFSFLPCVFPFLFLMFHHVFLLVWYFFSILYVYSTFLFSILVITNVKK